MNEFQPQIPNTLIANSKKDELQRSRGGENGMKTPVEDNSENLSIQLGARNAQFESGLDQEDSREMNFTTAEDIDLCRAYLVGLEDTTMEESATAFWDRVLHYFVNSNEAAILAYAASVGREFKFMEAYEIIKGDVLSLY
ncbi:hypothetical protein C5167_010641 [Papaver somniferum]|uniref:Uncharacterized protein n=1 Tax=Papaver somniferum TaxID=3469 RepID=A0A4Y7K3N5_PAPSO|nr:hypothetical protein C5167_010641 [Papaver somniferum]